MNSIQLVGRLTRDPEMRTTTNGKAYATFSIAVNKRIKPTDGSPDADFFNIKVWEKTADYVCNYLGKGRLISVTGSMESRKYTDKDGNRRELWEVTASQANGLDRAQEDSGHAPTPKTATSAPAQDQTEFDPWAD